MHEIRVSEAAERDLLDIFENGARQFGFDAAYRYRDGLQAAFSLLSKHPLMGRSRHDLRPKLRSRPYGSHVIFYRPDANAVLIARVLHGAMDAAGQFGAEAGDE